VGDRWIDSHRRKAHQEENVLSSRVGNEILSHEVVKGTIKG